MRDVAVPVDKVTEMDLCNTIMYVICDSIWSMAVAQTDLKSNFK